MSWINEGFSNLKGQISNFASNVLADEDTEVNTSELEELRQLCVQQKLEIENLNTINEELHNRSELNQSRDKDGGVSDGSWVWDSPDAKLPTTDQESTISELKERIALLEREKNDALSQMEQLDSENQQNLSEVVAMKEKLQRELHDLKLQLGGDVGEIQRLKSELEESEKQRKLLDSTNVTLEGAILDSKERINRVEADNKALTAHLQSAKEKIQQFERKSLEDEENCRKLAVILETYDKQVGTLKEELQLLKSESQCGKVEETKSRLRSVAAELEELKSLQGANFEELRNEAQALRAENGELRRQNEELLRQVSSRLDADLEEELERINAEHVAQMDLLEQEIDQLRNSEAHDEELRLSVERLRVEMNELEKRNKELLVTHEKVLNQLHDQYVNIITENIKKFQDCEKLSDFKHCTYEDDPQIADFSKQVENIMKILLDLKCKCQTLENKLMDLSEEKTSILTEKNHEIEKLMHNSEILSQEVLRKSQDLKEYEKECSELAANNELLIADMEAHKNNSMLQTISESNEDNMVLLESQLENANRRIEDLEKIIDDYDKERIEAQSESTSQEITNRASDYQDLLSSFDNLQIEHDALKSDLEASRDYLESINHEKSELKSALEKASSDNDNLEYQISELNVNYDSLKEEATLYKTQIGNLLKENSKMKFLAEEYQETNEELKSRLDFLEKKLAEEESERGSLELQVRALTEKLQNAKMAETSLKLLFEQKGKEMAGLSEANYNLEVSLKRTDADLAQFQANFAELQALNDTLSKEVEQLTTESEAKQGEIEKLEALVTELEKSRASSAVDTEASNKCSQLQQQLQELSDSRNELINLVTTKHQESVAYHNEIQRLTQVLTAENEKYRNLEARFDELQTKPPGEDLHSLEKLTDQNGFLREKCEVLAANLLEEQSKVQQVLAEKSEKEIALQKKLDRLQTHLVELEEHYTQELLQVEQKNAVLQARVVDLEEREKNSSTMYTSVSIRANQQVESLQKQLQVVGNEREELRKQISDAEDQNTKQAAALANLQYVLEQFRKDKEKDVHVETERIRRQIAAEKQAQEELKKEMAALKGQLEESNQGLQAASRLSDQLENMKRTVTVLKDEVSQLQSKLSKAEEDLKSASTNEKVDKSLVKNLIIGFVTSNNNLNKDQSQILKIIATVLDFNQQDHDKVNLHKPQGGSWLGSFLTAGNNAQSKMSAESLSQAFVRFLENESKPRAIPDLLSANGSSESGQSTPKQTPIVLSEIVLPTFADFAQNRNSSSILKDVLKDNS